MNSLQILLLVCFIGLSLSITGSDVVNCADNLKGAKYRSGAKGPTEFDCSGLAYYCHGSSIPINSEGQYAGGRPGTGAPGDLVFFSIDGNGVNHVGICIGNGQMIHAPNSHSVVRIETYEGNSYWQPKLVGFRRYAD